MKRSALALPVTAAAVVATVATTTGFAAGQQRFPQGRYASPLVAEDFTRYRGKMDPNFPHPWIITIRRGRWRTNERPAYGGTYLVHGKVITFAIRYPGNAAGTRERLRWSYGHGFLRFEIVSGVQGGDQAIYLAHPWRRLGR